MSWSSPIVSGREEITDLQNDGRKKRETGVYEKLQALGNGKGGEIMLGGGTCMGSQIKHRILQVPTGTAVPQLLRLPERGQLLFFLTCRSACSGRTAV